MAKCTVCGQEMLLVSGCSIPTIFIGGRKYQRVRVGDPGGFYQGGDANIGCTDCGAQMGKICSGKNLSLSDKDTMQIKKRSRHIGLDRGFLYFSREFS